MSSPNVRRPQIEHSSHQSTTTPPRVTEIAIQADRDAENEEAEKAAVQELDFDEPFLFSDAILIVEGRQIHCHRAILSIYSPVFKAMFRNRCLETQKNEVVISNTSYADVKEVLLHMYTPGGRDMSVESAEKLLPILHRYQIDSMVSLAERTLAFRLTDSTAPTCLQLADIYGLTRLRQAALESCARLDAERLSRVFQQVSLSAELRNEILERRVNVLEKCLIDIQNSFTHSCTRVESRMERVASNHCPEHSRPMAPVNIIPFQPSTRGSPPNQASADGQSPGASEAPGGQPSSAQHRMDVAASILPAAAALGNVTMRPVNDGHQPLSSSQSNLANVTPTMSGQTTAVCEKCVDQLKNHVIELCKRGLHKIPIIMLKNS